MGKQTGKKAPKTGVDVTPSPRFEASDPGLADYFSENGYVVVKNVASPEEVEAATELLWEFLATVGVDKEDQSTWTFPDSLGYADLGIMNSEGFNHSPCCWKIRQLSKVHEAYAQIWQTSEQLITSFDGGNIFFPWHADDDDSRKTTDGWFHCDQVHGGGECVRRSVSPAHAPPGSRCVPAGTHQGQRATGRARPGRPHRGHRLHGRAAGGAGVAAPARGAHACTGKRVWHRARAQSRETPLTLTRGGLSVNFQSPK
jgi:hypothetical protein